MSKTNTNSRLTHARVEILTHPDVIHHFHAFNAKVFPFCVDLHFLQRHGRTA